MRLSVEGGGAEMKGPEGATHCRTTTDNGRRTTCLVLLFWTRAIRRNFGSTVSTAKRVRWVDPATHHENSQHPPRTDARSQSSPSQPFLLFTPLPPSSFNLHITYHLNTDYY